ncbi:winged helix-turn-helix domain-containing protein [Erwinia rhapontici]|uniref:winged helix-turn-helix domain-containing protein n=1 Tax=Erwinia rhapontici TaxID=55212 RepID=UPI003BA178C4
MGAYFDPVNSTLNNGEKYIKLTIQEARCLDFFLRNEDIFINRKTLLEECWLNRGVIVSDTAVRQTLYRLRRVFDEAGIADDVLITQPRKGHLLQKGIILFQNTPVNGINSQPEDRQEDAVEAENNREALTVSRKPILRIAMLITLAVILFLSAAYVRKLSMVTEINYFPPVEIDGTFYFYLNNKPYSREALSRVNYWVKNHYVALTSMKYVYLNNAGPDNLSFYLCHKEMGSADSDCLSFTVIGHHRS